MEIDTLSVGLQWQDFWL